MLKVCYKRKADTSSSSSNNTGGKGKGPANSKSRSKSFTDQERARFLEYANCAFSMLGSADSSKNAAANP